MLSRADIEECRSRLQVSDSKWALRVFLSRKWVSKQEKSLCKIERKEFKKLPLGHEHAEHSWFQVEGGKIEGAESARQNWQIT